MTIKVIYLKPNNISDMLCLYMILDEWKLADIYKRNNRKRNLR